MAQPFLQVLLYQIQEAEKQQWPLDRALLPGARAGVTLHRRDVLVVHRRQVRVPVPRRGDGVAHKHVQEGQEHEPEQLEVRQLLGAFLRGV